MNQEGVSSFDRKAVLDGVLEMIYLAGNPALKTMDFGCWRTRDHINSGILKEYQSVDWYLQRAKLKGKLNQLDASQILSDLSNEPWRKENQGGKDHYDLFVVREDLGYEENNFVIGLAIRTIGTVFSTYRFNSLNERTRFECIKTETMHELGHVFGLIPFNRRENVEESIGLHCTNRCIMRQGLSVPNDWEKLSVDRLNYGALCKDCTSDLRKFFS